jgi:polysaccharide biosynthesis protein PslH
MTEIVRGNRRVLFLTPFPPRLDATHGGGRTVARTILGLAERERVGVLALRLQDEPPLDEALREQCEVAVEVARPMVGHSAMRLWTERRRLRLLLRGTPAWVTGCSVAEYERRFQVLLQSWRPHVVQMEFAVMGQYARVAAAAAPVRSVLVDHDPAPGRGTRSWDRYRASVMRDVDAVVVFTRRDEEALAPLAPTTRFVRIPITADVPERALDPVGGTPPNILFVGDYDHPPNVEAARRLARDIFPQVRAHHPDLVLELVGRNPPADLAGPGINLEGRVPDVTPYLDAAAIVVVPLQSGGGMRVKVLEALAAGKAVVASPLAVEGIDVVDGEQVVVADSDDELVRATLSLLGDPERPRALAARARSWAVANLGWDRAVAAYESLYESLLTAEPDEQRAAHEA